jgi:hypothetical protein
MDATTDSQNAVSSTSLRRGKWTREEELYTERIIEDFGLGYLRIGQGTTLRNYLSQELSCDPMRITKKFTGDTCIGKRVFTPVRITKENETFVEERQRELEKLKEDWLSKLNETETDRSRDHMKRDLFGGEVNLFEHPYSEERVRDTLNLTQFKKDEVDYLVSWMKRARNAVKFSNSIKVIQ